MIDYIELKNRNFERIELTCGVHFNRYGTYPFSMECWLLSRHKLSYRIIWHSEDRVAEMVAMDKEGTIVKRVENLTLKEIDNYLIFKK